MTSAGVRITRHRSWRSWKATARKTFQQNAVVGGSRTRRIHFRYPMGTANRWREVMASSRRTERGSSGLARPRRQTRPFPAEGSQVGTAPKRQQLGDVELEGCVRFDGISLGGFGTRPATRHRSINFVATIELVLFISVIPILALPLLIHCCCCFMGCS